MIKNVYFKAARCLQIGILAVSFLSAQTISEQDLQYLWKIPHEGSVKVVDVKTNELKNSRSVFFNSWYPDNPNRFYHSFSSYSKVGNDFSKLMSTFRNKSVFIQKQYNINSRELIIESSESKSTLTTLALDSLYNEEALWVLIPEMFIENVRNIKIWLLPTLSKPMDLSNEGLYSELVITNEKYLIIIIN